MSKELTPLEALNKLYDYALGNGTYSYGVCYNIIEKALKRLEIYDSIEKKIEETTPNKCILNDDGSIEIEDSDYLLVSKKEYQKKLKTLTIIKEKNVDVGMFRENGANVKHRVPLTQAEFVLLKEVLL